MLCRGGHCTFANCLSTLITSIVILTSAKDAARPASAREVILLVAADTLKGKGRGWRGREGGGRGRGVERKGRGGRGRGWRGREGEGEGGDGEERRGSGGGKEREGRGKGEQGEGRGKGEREGKGERGEGESKGHDMKRRREVTETKGIGLKRGGK